MTAVCNMPMVKSRVFLTAFQLSAVLQFTVGCTRQPSTLLAPTRGMKITEYEQCLVQILYSLGTACRPVFTFTVSCLRILLA